MSNRIQISNAVIRRLPKYHRYLTQILNNGIDRVSSQELSDITGFTASQIRQDLNNFGGFGQQGYGYNVKDLRKALEKIIGINGKYSTVLIGYGNLGKAILKYYKKSGKILRFEAIFDLDDSKDADGIPVYAIDKLEDYCDNNEVDIVVLTTPVSISQEIIDRIANKGIKGVWNFTPKDIVVPDDIIVENVHLDESLATLIYYIGSPEDYKG